jgi:hypothetical protein
VSGTPANATGVHSLRARPPSRARASAGCRPRATRAHPSAHQLEPGAERNGVPVPRRALEGVGHGERDGSTRRPAAPPGRSQLTRSLGWSGTWGLSSIQMNPQLSHRKNTLLGNSATMVRVFCSHTGQRAVTSSGGRQFGSLGNGIGDQRSHTHVCRQPPQRYSITPCVTPSGSGSAAPHDRQRLGDGSCSRRPLRVRARRS